MTFRIGRRQFIILLGGAAAAWPLAARAQQTTGRIWRLGILSPAAPPDPLVEAIRLRLRELGYIDGRNVVFEYRWAEGKLDRFTASENVRFSQLTCESLWRPIFGESPEVYATFQRDISGRHS